MRADLERKLEQEFPFMKRDRANGEETPYSEWGCECGDGWYPLLRDLCRAVADRYQMDGRAVDLVILQVKEKYAGLRFYYTHTDSAGCMQMESQEALRKLRGDVAGIVERFEQKSEETCESCGKRGVVREDLDWMQTLCEDCYKAALKNRK